MLPFLFFFFSWIRDHFAHRLFSSSPQMVSSLDNWDGSLSSAAKQNASRLIDLLESSGANKSLASTNTAVPDERSNVFGNGLGWHDMVTGLDLNHTTVCCLFNGVCMVAQVAVYLVRRVKFG